MIRVRLEVGDDTVTGINHVIEREETVYSAETPMSERLDTLIASARSSMHASLKAVPQELPPNEVVIR